MFVNVKTEKIQQTNECHLSLLLSAVQLNKVQRLSVAQEKTCFNFSRGGRIQLSTPIVTDTHYWRWDQGCFLLASVFPGMFFNFKQTLPPGDKSPGFCLGEF